MTSRFLLVTFVLCVLVSGVHAQSDRTASPAQTTEPEVRATIEALFDGMRAGDSAQVRTVFHDNARLHTALGPSETGAVRSTPVDSFLAAVGRPHDRTWDERIWDVEIRVDGPLASAWVPYVFYLGDERSHCGVNAVQLVKTGNGWKILQLTDTRRETCDVPPEVQK
jgi:hypothetical protein